MWSRVLPVAILILAAAGERSLAADLSVVLTNFGLTLNNVGVGSVVDDRAELSPSAFMQTLGPPDRSRVDRRTQRITWDDKGIQLEAIAPEGTAFAVLFQFANHDSTNQAVIPSQPYQGTFKCNGVSLSAGERIEAQATLLAAAGFNKNSESASGQMWSLRLEHWEVFLRFSAAGTIDSAVVRVLPDLY